MSQPACPMCEMTDVLELPEKWGCVTYGHEWPRKARPEEPDAACVGLMKDLKLGGIAIGLKA